MPRDEAPNFIIVVARRLGATRAEFDQQSSGGIRICTDHPREGRELSPIALIAAELHVVSPGCFQTMGIPLVAGRYLNKGASRVDPLAALRDEQSEPVVFLPTGMLW